MGLLKIFQQNLHIYHRNDSTSLCTIHFIYILVLEDVISSDLGGRFLLVHPVDRALNSYFMIMIMTTHTTFDDYRSTKTTEIFP